ncbi:MAG TPA: hypothetical protein VNO32_45670 [Candidatus Acidoferrum sp.]|nr:hypothetical protein [Candidatus Acidoferrum sp.]
MNAHINLYGYGHLKHHRGMNCGFKVDRNKKRLIGRIATRLAPRKELKRRPFLGLHPGFAVPPAFLPIGTRVARLPHGGSEREPSGARPAADGGATNAGRRDIGAAHHADLRLEDHVDVPPLRDDGTQRAAAGTREARRV